MPRVSLMIKIVLLAFVVSVGIRYVLLQPFVVPENAMAPQFQEGDVVLVNRWGTPQRGDIVVFRRENSERSMRRIVALPGERIRVNDGILSVESEEALITQELPLFGTTALTLSGVGKIDAHEYFVMPDHNTKEGNGLIDKKDIIGTPIGIIYPFSRLRVFNN